MDSHSNHRRSKSGGCVNTLTRMCSINAQGVVFLARRRMKLSAELTLAVQSSVLGINFHWDVHGWVVDCRQVRCEEGVDYQVTLLFSEVPEGLRRILALAEGHATHAYPEVEGAPHFGLN